MRVIPGKNGINRFELVDKSATAKAKHFQELLQGPPDSDDEEAPELKEMREDQSEKKGKKRLAPPAKEKTEDGGVYIPPEVQEAVKKKSFFE